MRFGEIIFAGKTESYTFAAVLRMRKEMFNYSDLERRLFILFINYKREKGKELLM